MNMTKEELLQAMSDAEPGTFLICSGVGWIFKMSLCKHTKGYWFYIDDQIEKGPVTSEAWVEVVYGDRPVVAFS